jgi:tRNA modification GTPase
VSDPPRPPDGPIAAVSTPAGRGFHAMVRLSGAGTYEILARRVPGIEPTRVSGGRVLRSSFRPDRSPVVPARFVCFRAPRSYTGEDLAEVHLPGVPGLTAAVLETLFREGARPAGPGEFTRRAYLAGRLDLTRAEGIQALVAASDEAERRGALALTGGRVAARVEELRESLVSLLADMEASLDFSEHEVEPAVLAGLGDRLVAIRSQVEGLVALTRGDARPSREPRVILWGHPNAGKSTLFNRLIGRERAATDPAPGTTRDVLGARLGTPRGGVLLFDAPGVGLVATGEAGTAALLTAEAHRQGMDLRIVVADVGSPRPPPDPGPGDCLLVLAKADLPVRLDPGGWIAACRPRAVVEVSALVGTGLERLRAAVGEWLAGSSPGTEAIVVSSRLRALFDRAVEDLARVEEEHARGFGPECLSIHVRGLLASLEEVTGRVFTEDLLDRVFSRFCIGK